MISQCSTRKCTMNAYSAQIFWRTSLVPFFSEIYSLKLKYQVSYFISAIQMRYCEIFVYLDPELELAMAQNVRTCSKINHVKTVKEFFDILRKYFGISEYFLLSVIFFLDDSVILTFQPWKCEWFLNLFRNVFRYVSKEINIGFLFSKKKQRIT